MFKINYQQPVRLQKKLDFLKYMGRVLDQEVGLKDCYIGILNAFQAFNEKANNPQQQFGKDVYLQWTSCITGKILSK